MYANNFFIRIAVATDSVDILQCMAEKLKNNIGINLFEVNIF